MRIINEKTAQYKLLWIGNGKGSEGIFLVKKWIKKVINIIRVSDRMVVKRYLLKGLLFH